MFWRYSCRPIFTHCTLLKGIKYLNCVLFFDGKRFVNLICHRRIISTNFKGLSLYKIARQFIQLAVANQSYLHYLSIFFTLLQKILLSLLHYHLLVLPVFPLVYHSIYCVYCCCCWLGNQCDLRRELPTRF